MDYFIGVLGITRTSVLRCVLLGEIKRLTQRTQRKTGAHRDRNGTGFTAEARGGRSEKLGRVLRGSMGRNRELAAGEKQIPPAKDACGMTVFLLVARFETVRHCYRGKSTSKTPA
jgi:hypothetical protein